RSSLRIMSRYCRRVTRTERLEYFDRIIQTAIGELETIATVHQLRHDVETLDAVLAVIEGVIGEAKKRAGFRIWHKRRSCTGLELWKDHPARHGSLIDFAHAVGRRLEMSNRAFDRLVGDWTDHRVRREFPNDVDRLILQADGPREWNGKSVERIK